MNDMKLIGVFVVGAAIGIFVYNLFTSNEKVIEEVVVERYNRVVDTVIVSDTVMRNHYITVYDARPDTVFIEGNDKHYVTQHDDSILHATVISTVRGELTNTEFRYHVKYPEIKTNTFIRDSIFLEREITVTEKINSLYLSAGVPLNGPRTNLSAMADFTNKKGWIFGYRAEFDRSGLIHNLKVGKRISFR